MPVTFYEGAIRTDQETDNVHTSIKSSGENHFIGKINIQNSFCNSFSSGLSVRTVFKGPVKYEFEQKNRVLCPDNIIPFNKGQEFRSYNYQSAEAELFSIFFNDEFVKRFHADAVSHVERSLENVDHVLPNALMFDNEVMPSHPSLYYKIITLRQYLSGGYFAQNIADEQLSLLFEDIFYTQRKDLQNVFKNIRHVKLSSRKEIARRVYLARDYIECNFTRPTSLLDISKNSFLSENHLLRNFKAVFQISPGQYIIKRRLELAKTLLCSTYLSVSNIVSAVGFENQSSFGRLFKKVFHLAPEQWRQKNKGIS